MSFPKSHSECLSELGCTPRSVWCQNWHPASTLSWPSPVAEDMRSWRDRSPRPCHGVLRSPFFLLGWLGPPPLAPAHQHLLRATSCRGAPSQPGYHPQQHQEVREVGSGCRDEAAHVPGSPSSSSVSLFALSLQLISLESLSFFVILSERSISGLCLCLLSA